MNKARQDGLIFLFLGSLLFLALGFLQEISIPIRTSDFQPIYYGARTLLAQRDPYRPAEVLSVFRAEGGDRPSLTDSDRAVAGVYLYLPSAFAVSLPLALLSWSQAQALWILLMAAANLAAAFAIWSVGARSAPLLSGLLTGWWLANNMLAFTTGNPAGPAVALCILAVVCFQEERFAAAGVLAMALSLALKPQDAALIWLCFFLAGGTSRKRALQTAAVLAALCLPALVWTWRVSPHWFSEFLANYRAFAAPGGINDPGPGAPAARGVAVIASLERVFSFFGNDPRFYHLAGLLVCLPLLGFWGFFVWRRRGSRERLWTALAAAAALSMISSYHRQYDAKLILLAVPPCAMLWARGGRRAKAAPAVTAAALFCNADLPMEVYQAAVRGGSHSAAGWEGRLALAGFFFPLPLALLGAGIFFLVLFARSSPDEPAASAMQE